MAYNPDRWTIVKIENKKTSEVLYKILASWYGSYLYGGSWKLNSGIVAYEESDNSVVFHGYSGSEYDCIKNYVGMNSIMGEIYQQMVESARKTDCEISVISFEQFKGEF